MSDAIALGGTGTFQVLDNASATILSLYVNANSGDSSGITTVSGGADLTTGLVRVGSGDGYTGTGTLNVDGSGSTLTQTGTSTLILGNTDTPGNNGVHTINVTNSGVFNTGSGTTTINKTGTLNINTNGVFNANGDVTIDGGTINRNGNFGFVLAGGKTFTARNDAQVQFTGYYYLDQNFVIESGADMSLTDAVDLGAGVIGQEANFVGSDASLIVDGPGSTFHTNTTNSINSNDWGSDGGSATVTVRNQGMITIGGTAELNLVSSFLGGNDQATVTVQSGGQFNANNIELASVTGSDAVGQITVTGTGSAVTQTGASTLTVGATSATGSGTVTVSDNAGFTTGTGTTTINTTGTLKIDNGEFIANGAMNFNGGTLHTVLSNNSNPAAAVVDALTISPSSTLKIELAPGFTPVVSDSFLIIGSLDSINSTFTNFVGKGIGGGLYFEQSILTISVVTGIIIEVEQALPGDTDYDGDVDDADLGVAFSSYTGPVGLAGLKSWDTGDFDGDGDVDDGDLGVAFSNYTGPLSPGSNVPEPASALILFALGGCAGLRRRRSWR